MFIPLGEPWKNGYVESFHSRQRDEFWNITTIGEALQDAHAFAQRTGAVLIHPFDHPLSQIPRGLNPVSRPGSPHVTAQMSSPSE